MLVEPGQMLSHYRLVEKIGEGGMGVVWKAEDTTLRRDVALKILPEVFARDRDRRTRFSREAHLLASLNHTNIAAIHGFEEVEPSAGSGQGGVSFLVLEMVPGATLAERVAAGPIEIAEALAIARQIAEGVEAAHAKGIVHRDLKPANVKVTEEGGVKVLDFGLAKAFSEDRPADALSQSPTITAMATRDGVILGTAGYMSPEQAKARPVDHRSDIWSFGCVLYEMLTGRPAFAGDSVATSLANILEREPDWEALPAGLSAPMRRLLRRCLMKDVSRRLQAIGDARIEIQEWLESPTALAEEVTVTRTPAWRRVAPWIALPLVAAAVWALKPSPRPTVSPTARFEIVLPEGKRLTHAFRHGVAISPDGHTVAFIAGATPRNAHSFGGGVSGRQIHLRRLDDWKARPVPGTEKGYQPMFSPDSKWLGFAAVTSEGRFLKKVPVTGGEPVKVCKLSPPFGASWGPDDTIVYGLMAGGLMRVPAVGGEPERLTELDAEAGEDSHRLPHWLPDGKALLYTAMSGGSLDMRPRVFVHTVETGERKLLIEVGMDARYVPTGHLVFAREGRLLVVPFDRSRLEVTGREVPVLDGVAHLTHTGSGGHETKAAQFDLSSTGTLVYAAGSVFPELETPVVWVDREGREEPLGMEPRGYWSVRISPDGGSVLLNASDVWLFDVERKTSRRQTFEGAEGNAIWGPEPDRFSFNANREGISALYSKGINSGPGDLQRLPSEPGEFSASSWSSDGKRLAFVGSSGEDVWVLDAEGHAELFLGTQFIHNYPEFSPDDRWIVHTSNESGRAEVYVRPYPGPGPSVQISRGGGSHPAWSRDGREIFYRWPSEAGHKFFAVSIDSSGDRLTAGEPIELFDGNAYLAMSPVRPYDVAPDGRFLFIKWPDEAAQSAAVDKVFPDRIRVVQNWFDELRAKMGTNR